MATTYTVKKGDTLTSIAAAYSTTVSNLVKWNDIDDPDFIVIGQMLYVTAPSTSSSSKANKTSKAVIKQFGLQSNKDNTLYAVWKWDKSNTDHYAIKWYYTTGVGVWFIGTDSTTTNKQCTYTPPENAKIIKFRVKPVSKKRKVNGKDTAYWTASWSTDRNFNLKDLPPSTPPVPTVTIDKYKLTAELNNLDVNASTIQFQVVKNNKSVFKSAKANIATTSATYSCTVDAGGEYKVRCRAYRDEQYSEWSEYSDNVGTIPSAPSTIITLKALSETSIYIDWENVSNATEYEVQYTTKKSYFDSSNEVKSMTVDATAAGHAEITGLESGNEYFFRVRAKNEQGESTWGEVKSIIIGKKPVAPTTWSSTTTAITGESLILYWVHNSEDGSSQTYAELELTIGGSTTTQTIKNSTDEDEKDKTSSYTINTSSYSEGTTIQWRVRTAGITNEYGEWSTQRVIDIYAPATLQINMTDVNGDAVDTLTTFPFYVSALAGPNTQRPIGYHLSISSNEIYETVDKVGNVKFVNIGEQLYSKYFDITDSLLVEFSAGNIDLENNIEYTLSCTVSMNSGLTATSSLTFTVNWEDEQYEPNAEIGYDEETYTVSIHPYCLDENDTLISDITLSVYRREFDGSFVELATGLSNTVNTFITDPHPALDYARYRIVAVTNSTGAVSYYDMPGYPIGETAAIIQWDEEWTNFDTSTVNEGDELEQPSWSGSLLRLPYNIDVSDKYSPDVSLIEYTGRSHPVSYYGTQKGSTSSWSVEIPKYDEETLYTIRRLSIWMGDVYVREPSGSGYWANVKVSYDTKHCELTIPITLDITRVEGGA